MNSGSERKLSTEELMTRQKMNLARAKEATSQVVLTDGNWGALINSIQVLTDGMSRILTQTEALATEEDMDSLLTEQAERLRREQTDSLTAMEDLLARIQAAQEEQTEALTAQTKESVSEIQSLAGREKERFSSACSEMKDGMKRWLGRVMWIALIPSALVFVLELLRLIFSAV